MKDLELRSTVLWYTDYFMAVSCYWDDDSWFDETSVVLFSLS